VATGTTPAEALGLEFSRKARYTPVPAVTTAVIAPRTLLTTTQNDLLRAIAESSHA
jgi:hypothetical protein